MGGKRIVEWTVKVSTVTCDSQFKQRVLTCCYDSMEDAGFRRTRKHDADWHLNPEFDAWVGLNTALDPQRLEINPFVGVHAPVLERLWMDLSRLRYPGRYGRSATYAKHIGELETAQRERTFIFEAHSTEHAIRAEAQRLARLLRTTGIDYARAIASYDALLPLMYERAPMLGGYPQRICCCLYLMDRPTEARALAGQWASEEPDAFGSFAETFIEYLDRRH